MNALQALIQQYRDEHPGESYASIARRGGLPPGTVQAVARRPRKRQVTEPDTLAKLAKGMNLPYSVVEAAARQAAGLSPDVVQIEDEELMILLATTRELTPDRKRELARRARFLLEEQQEAESVRRRR